MRDHAIAAIAGILRLSHDAEGLTTAERDSLREWASTAKRVLDTERTRYPHQCRDDHEEIGWRGDDERCPVCRMRDALEAERARREGRGAMTRERLAEIRELATVSDATVSIRTRTLCELLAALDAERQHADALAEAMRDEGHGKPENCPMRDACDEEPCRICEGLATHATRRGATGGEG